MALRGRKQNRRNCVPSALPTLLGMAMIMAPKAKARAARQSWQAAHETCLRYYLWAAKRFGRKGEAMKAIVLVVLLLISGALAAQTPTGSETKPKLPKNMRQYFFGFLVKGEKWNESRSKEELAELMNQHLAYIRSQAAAGRYKLAGPFLDDGQIRGFLIIDAASSEEARQIVSGDPMLKVGRMAVEIHPAMFADVSCVLTEYERNRAQ